MIKGIKESFYENTFDAHMSPAFFENKDFFWDFLEFTFGTLLTLTTIR
jgi:hypothetical protein